MADFDEMNKAMDSANKDWRKLYMEAQEHLNRLQKEHWELRDELMEIKYQIIRLANGKRIPNVTKEQTDYWQQ